MFDEREVEDPVPGLVSVFHLHEKVREHHERAQEEAAEDQRELHVQQRTGHQSESLSGKAQEKHHNKVGKQPDQLDRLMCHEICYHNVYKIRYHDQRNVRDGQCEVVDGR